MAVFEITKFGGGISDYEDKGIAGSFKFGSNLDVRKDVDSLSCQQALTDEGLLVTSQSPSLSVSPSATQSPSPSLSPSASSSPTPSPSASVSPSASKSLSPSVTPSASISPSPSPSAGLTTVFEDLIRFFVKCSDGYTYGFGNTGHIYRRDADAFWQWVYKDADGAIKGAEEMPASGGKSYLGWATDKTVKRKPIPGQDNWNDVETLSTELASADWHTMKQIGGATKIANGSWLAMVGYDESFTNEALDLIPGNIAKTIVERNGRAIVGTFKRGFPTKGINAAIDAEYKLAQIGDDGALFIADGSTGVSTKRFPGGGIVNPGGVCNETDDVLFFEWEETALSWIDKQSLGNMTFFGVYDADANRNGIYSYGRRNKNKPFILNLEYALEVDEIGAVVNVDGTTLSSYQDGTDFGVKAVSTITKQVGTYEGLDLKAPVKKPVNITNWKTTELFMNPLPEGTSVEFWYKIDKTGSFTQAYLADGSTNYAVTNGKKAVFRVGADGEIFEPRVVLNPLGNNSPEVYRIRVNFE